MAGAARIIAIDVVPTRLQLACELGATETIDASAADPVAALMELSSGRGVEYSIEASGTVAVLAQAMRVLAPRGTCAILGTYGPGVTVPLQADYMLDGRRVIGVSEGGSDPATFIPALVRLHQLGKLPLEKLIRHYPFGQIEQAAADARAGKTIKPVLLYD